MLEERRRNDDTLPGKIWWLARQTRRRMQADRTARLGAALAFYAVFLIAPVLMIVLGVVGLVYDAPTARAQVIQEARALFGSQLARSLQVIIESAAESERLGATVIGVIALILSSTAFFNHLQGALNTVWGLSGRRRRGLGDFARNRLLALLFLFILSALVIGVLAADSAMIVARRRLIDVLPGFEGTVFEEILRLGFSIVVLRFGMVTLLTGLIFKVLPDAKIEWRDVWVGAAVTALLLLIGQILIGVMLELSRLASAYGALGSLVVVLLWVYYSAQVFFAGAEFTYVYAKEHGDEITRR